MMNLIEKNANTNNSVITKLPNEFQSLQDFYKDYDSTRNNLIDLIDKGTNLLDHISVLAIDSEAARVYEVASNIISNIATMNKNIIELHEKRRNLEKSITENKTTTQNNNDDNALTTQELLKSIKKENAEI